MHTVIVGGASITDDIVFPTWKTYISRRYNINLVNTAIKGIGNKTILLRTYNTCLQYENPLPVIMLTSMDKWDWYMPNQEAYEKFKNEKHPITPLNDKDHLGVWATGSWFPLIKEEYLQKFYNQDYNTLENLIFVQWFVNQCVNNNWPYIILFDSPIYDHYEQEVNNLDTLELNTDRVVKNSIVEPVYKNLEIENLYRHGLIGYAQENGLPWKGHQYNPHPGSLIHYKFSCEHIFPILDDMFPVILEDDHSHATKMQKLWDHD